MSTICFDIKRVDENYVCINQCNGDMFNTEYHLPLSFYPRKRNGKNHWWLEDKKYRYIWIAVRKEKDTGIERPVWACNDKIWFNSAIKQFFKDDEIRVLKLPFDRIVKKPIIKEGYEGQFIKCCEPNDMGDKFKLYCPVDLNEKYHVYADHYEEIDPVVTNTAEIDGKTVEFKERRFKWIPPKYLGEE